MPDVSYRQLISADYNDYRRIRLDSLKEYPNNFGAIYEEELNSKSLKLEGAIKFANDGNFAFGALSPEKMIGICGFVTDFRLKTKHRGEIVHMFVDTEYTGQGIGKKLLQLTIDKAFNNNQTEQIVLGVVYTNENAIKLYKQFGFVEYGKLERYFKAGSQYFTQLFFSLTKVE